ncbi:hypothetical protein ACC713_20295 [Rhizobium johnstonii]|uniref:hypothetical protein n=1 Tax=Rhizobium johnstonii TaxID=3019933 RepID=UPI003F97771A
MSIVDNDLNQPVSLGVRRFNSRPPSLHTGEIVQISQGAAPTFTADLGSGDTKVVPDAI